VFLDGGADLIGRRIAARHGHYMKPQMLASQLADLERPTPDEHVVTVQVQGSPAEIVDHVVEALGLPTP
jgi:gluconokinase